MFFYRCVDLEIRSHSEMKNLVWKHRFFLPLHLYVSLRVNWYELLCMLKNYFLSENMRHTQFFQLFLVFRSLNESIVLARDCFIEKLPDECETNHNNKSHTRTHNRRKCKICFLHFLTSLNQLCIQNKYMITYDLFIATCLLFCHSYVPCT